MGSIPLETSRLRMRLLERSDAPASQKAAHAREIADTIISLPHPYPDGEAELYVVRRLVELGERRSAIFVMELRYEKRFCGPIKIRDIDRERFQGN